MTASFRIGMMVQYDECQPNIEAIRRLCVLTDAMIAEYRREFENGKYRCLAIIEEINEADEDEGEPTTFKLKPVTNLENYPEAFIWAVESELSELSELIELSVV